MAQKPIEPLSSEEKARIRAKCEKTVRDSLTAIEEATGQKISEERIQFMIQLCEISNTPLTEEQIEAVRQLAKSDIDPNLFIGNQE